MANYIEENNLTLKRVLNTHLHLDHAFGNSYLFDRFNVGAEANAEDEFLLNDMQRQAELFGINKVDEIKELSSNLNEGDKIILGDIELDVLHVPGHSPGSLVFYSKKDNCAFVGDVLFNGSIGRTDLAKGNHEQLISGIKSKLLTLPENTIIFSGHGPNTTIKTEKQINSYLK